MRKNNLWITALAFGLSLSAYGQQAEGGISSGMLQEIKQAYKGTPADKAIHNAIVGNDINKLAVNNDSKNNFDTYFSNKVNSKGITNQKSSGRCWLFTGLNVIRAQVIAKYNLPEFELSQNYNFFWDQHTVDFAQHLGFAFCQRFRFRDKRIHPAIILSGIRGRRFEEQLCHADERSEPRLL